MPFDPGTLPASALQTLLESHSLVLVDEKNGQLRETTSAILIDASPKEVEKVVRDFASYQEWMPQVSRSQVVGGKGGATDAEFTLSFRFSVFSKSVRYTLRYKDGGEGLTWSLVSGDFSENRGAYRWLPVDKGKRTAFFYSFYVDLASMGSMIRFAFKSTPQLEVAIASSTAVVVARAIKARVEG